MVVRMHTRRTKPDLMTLGILPHEQRVKLAGTTYSIQMIILPSTINDLSTLSPHPSIVPGACNRCTLPRYSTVRQSGLSVAFPSIETKTKS